MGAILGLVGSVVAPIFQGVLGGLLGNRAPAAMARLAGAESALIDDRKSRQQTQFIVGGATALAAFLLARKFR